MIEPERTYYHDGTLRTETEIIDGRTRVRQYGMAGSLEWEGTFINGTPDGVARRWHANGVLASESSFTKGLADGTQKAWNEQGEVLGSYEMVMGTGLFKSWYPNGQLQGEIPLFSGGPHGRQRVWDEEGELLAEQYYLRGKKISKKKYREAAAKDRTLPRYDGPDGEIAWSEQVSEPAVESHSISIADYPDARDALEWLQESSAESLRTLGELADADESIELVYEFLTEKAGRVLVVAIQDEEDAQTSSQLLVELPLKPAAARKRALAHCNQQNGQCGFSPIKDTGQRFMHVALD